MLSHQLFTMASSSHWSQDCGSQGVNRMSSQVNGIKPFKIKVQYLSICTDLGHAITALSKTFLLMNTIHEIHRAQL